MKPKILLDQTNSSITDFLFLIILVCNDLKHTKTFHAIYIVWDRTLHTAMMLYPSHIFFTKKNNLIEACHHKLEIQKYLVEYEEDVNVLYIR